MGAKAEEYILGVEPGELERLRFQHTVWVERQYALLERAGLRAGARVLDLGCGPGFTSIELARIVGEGGRVVARDRSEAFLGHLARLREEQGLPWIEPSHGPLEVFEPAPASFELAYARWLFCWLEEPEPVFERVARALTPGGALVLHEYLDWAAMKLLPHSAVFERAVEACMQSWRLGGATIDFAERVPELARRHGLVLEHFRPLARAGAVGSLEWRWLGTFFAIYLPKLVERGLLAPQDERAFAALWRERDGEREGLCVAPTMAEVVLRRP